MNDTRSHTQRAHTGSAAHREVNADELQGVCGGNAGFDAGAVQVLDLYTIGGALSATSGPLSQSGVWFQHNDLWR